MLGYFSVTSTTFTPHTVRLEVHGTDVLDESSYLLIVVVVIGATFLLVVIMAAGTVLYRRNV